MNCYSMQYIVSIFLNPFLNESTTMNSMSIKNWQFFGAGVDTFVNALEGCNGKHDETVFFSWTLMDCLTYLADQL